MKNAIKLPLLALVVSLSLGACKGNKSSGGADSAQSGASQSGSATTRDTVRHADTVLKVDTVKKGTDTSDMQTDTVKKTIKSKTVIKTLDVKKGQAPGKK